MNLVWLIRKPNVQIVLNYQSLIPSRAHYEERLGISKEMQVMFPS